MKPFPRLPAAPWTLHDVLIWRRLAMAMGSRRIGDLAVWRYVHADRRDAALMLDIGQGGQLRINTGEGPCDFEAWLFPRFWFMGAECFTA